MQTVRLEHGTARLPNMSVPAHGTQQAMLRPLPQPVGRPSLARKITRDTTRLGTEGGGGGGGLYKPPSWRPQTLTHSPIPIPLSPRRPLIFHTLNPNLIPSRPPHVAFHHWPPPASIAVLHFVKVSTVVS